jgi:hypothetical protein
MLYRGFLLPVINNALTLLDWSHLWLLVSDSGRLKPESFALLNIEDCVVPAHNRGFLDDFISVLHFASAKLPVNNLQPSLALPNMSFEFSGLSEREPVRGGKPPAKQNPNIDATVFALCDKISRKTVPAANSPGFLPRGNTVLKLLDDSVRNDLIDTWHIDSPLIVICGLIE